MPAHQPAMSPSALAPDLYSFRYKDIDGKDVPMSAYKGRVVLIVNVASKCGLTPQYKGLQNLYNKYKAKGLVIVGFPANDFGGQEPGTEAEIKTFCSTKYDVTFPMASKIVVTGSGKSPLYQWLIAKSGRDDEIEWNFSKFVVGRDGKSVVRFSPKSTPESPEVIAAIEKALG